jgi:hypothetical protein
LNCHSLFASSVSIGHSSFRAQWCKCIARATSHL